MRRRKSFAELMLQDFLSLTELGQVFGMTNQKAGRHLADADLWIINVGPTHRALMLKLVKPQGYEDRPDNQFKWLWRRDETIAILQARGLTLVEP